MRECHLPLRSLPAARLSPSAQLPGNKPLHRSTPKSSYASPRGGSAFAQHILAYHTWACAIGILMRQPVQSSNISSRTHGGYTRRITTKVSLSWNIVHAPTGHGCLPSLKHLQEWLHTMTARARRLKLSSRSTRDSLLGLPLPGRSCRGHCCCS
ncbi:hypothetical protein GY45DRAFT_572957 [Cubamyces sp. BRFM 1775]|nr:hypothetical protein GY45DRAFT_572957 [Cubamyces sp. BRFM 1775]